MVRGEEGFVSHRTRTAGGSRRQNAVTVSDEQATEDLVDAVLQSSRALVALAARSIAGAGGVTLPQFRMLVVLEAGQTNLRGLAAALDVAPSTATRMVDRLIDAGLVHRSIPTADRREISLTLTNSGRRTVRTVTERRRRDLRRVVDQIPRNRRAAVARAMTDFSDAAERVWGSADRKRTR
jgi:DNA-binding MarR family transcriptional regulator